MDTTNDNQPPSIFPHIGNIQTMSKIYYTVFSPSNLTYSLQNRNQNVTGKSNSENVTLIQALKKHSFEEQLLSKSRLAFTEIIHPDIFFK